MLSFQPGKPPLEVAVHRLPLPVMFSVVIVILVEYWKPECFLATVYRIYCLLVLGSWFIHTSHIMYTPPGRPFKCCLSDSI